MRGAGELPEAGPKLRGHGSEHPQAKEIVKLRVYRLIREEYNGANVRALATKYGVSESTVYNVIREQLRDRARERRCPDIPGQLSIVDLLDSG